MNVDLPADHRLGRSARILLVVLRLAIGWHFFYEGIVKLHSYEPWRQPFSSEAYLQASSGPLRPLFRALVPDKDGLARLSRAGLERALDERQAAIVAHFSRLAPLDAGQQAALRERLDDIKGAFQAKIEERHYTRRLVAEERKYLDIDRQLYALDLQPDERGALIRARNEQRAALARIAGRPATFWDGIRTRADLRKRVIEIANEALWSARVADYQLMVEHQAEGEALHTAFAREREVALATMLQKNREALLAVVRTPLRELDQAARQLLSADQLRLWEPARWTSQTALIDALTAWGLTLAGVCLMLGLLTRPAAWVAVAFLTLFYLAAPPWPGLAEPAVAEGHYLIINKNLIELLAAVLLAMLPTAEWAGLDPLVRRHVTAPLIARWRRRRLPPAVEATAAGAAPARPDQPPAAQ
jgi:uncharacterized membrane protein YphA (DoxX/SURF4 family)